MQSGSMARVREAGAAVATGLLLMSCSAAADQLGLQITTPDFSNGYVLHDGSIVEDSAAVVGAAWESFSQEYTVTRVWLTMDEIPTLRNAAISGSDLGELALDPGADGSFFRSLVGNGRPPLTEAVLGAFPEAAFDSFMTAGHAVGTTSNLLISFDPSALDSTFICSDCYWSGSGIAPEYFVPYIPHDSTPGVRILMAQLTTRTPHEHLIAGTAFSGFIREYVDRPEVTAACCAASWFGDCDLAYSGLLFNSTSAACDEVASRTYAFEKTLVGVRSMITTADGWDDRYRPGFECALPGEVFPHCDDETRRIDLRSRPDVDFVKAGCPIPAGFFGEGSIPVYQRQFFCSRTLTMAWQNDPFARCAPVGGEVQSFPVVLDNFVYAASEGFAVMADDEVEHWFCNMEPAEPVQGTLTVRKTHCNGGTFDLEASFCPIFTFTRSGKKSRVFSPCDECDSTGVRILIEDAPWSMFTGGIGVPAQDGDDPYPCTLFRPGFETLDPQTTDCHCPCFADCAPPGGGDGDVDVDDLLAVVGAISTQDLRCDITPIKANGTPGNEVVNVDDILTVIQEFGPCP